MATNANDLRTMWRQGVLACVSALISATEAESARGETAAVTWN
jgi:hypothetical protein